MSKLIGYIDRTRATIAILRDYRDQIWKLENEPKRIREIEEGVTSPRGMSAAAVHGGGSRFEEHLCAVIDQKDLLREGHRQAEEYEAEFLPCWERLTNTERDLLTLRFVDYREGNGINAIMEKHNVSKSEAYNRSNAALDRLTKLLFW